jgi:feruloyl esterase
MLTRLFAGALLLASIEPLVAQQACSGLSALSLPHTTITSAVSAPEGAVPSAGPGNAAPVAAPAHCDVQAVARPTKDSEIRLQIWLPVSG